MFTKKTLFDWRLRPHRSGGSDLVSNPRSNGDTSDDDKGKSVASLAYGERISPHSGSLDGGGGAEASDWQRFREAGLLDESFMEKQDREALLQKIAKLEHELYDYQYNMGLLLIEKKDRDSTYEKLRQAFTEAQETLRREQTAHLMALSEVEKREESLRKALEIEKQCVADYKAALRAICPKSEEMELTSDKKMAEAQEKSMGVEAKLHATDAKVAEVNQKSLEMERKLNKSPNAEKEITEVTWAKQSKEVQEWENSLQEREEGKSEPVNAVVEEANIIHGETPDPIEGKQLSGTTDVSAGRGVGNRGAAAVTTSEQNLDGSEANSVGITASGRRKRRASISRGSQTPGERQYNLRQRKM